MNSTLKFGVYEKRVAIVALHERGTMTKMIRRVLKPLFANEQFVSQTVARYQETSDEVDRPSEGHPRSVRT